MGSPVSREQSRIINRVGELSSSLLKVRIVRESASIGPGILLHFEDYIPVQAEVDMNRKKIKTPTKISFVCSKTISALERCYRQLLSLSLNGT